MTALGTAPPMSPTAAGSELSPQLYRRIVEALIVAQAAVLVVVMSSGWYYNDDFALLMNSSHRPLGWNYLKMPINDHLLPGLRLEFWVLRHTTSLNYPVTIGIRVVLQTVGTALLVLILTTLAGRRRRILVVAALYALCPLVLTNSLWLTVALSLLSAQVCVLAAIYAHIRSSVTGSLRWALASGLLLLGGALFWEKAAVTALLLPILSVGYLTDGTVRDRLLALLRHWRGWLLVTTPIGAFTAYFIATGYGGASSSVKLSDLIHVWWLQWSRVVSPSILGGPWRWFDMPNVSLGFAAASGAEVVLTQVAVATVVVLGVRLVGPRSLLAWSIPLVPLAVGTALVAAGRFSFFGDLIATTLRYGADLAAPLFIGVALAVTPTSPAAIRARLEAATIVGVPRQQASAAGPTDAPRMARLRRPRRHQLMFVIAAAAAAGWLVGALASVARFDGHWSKNPAHAYVTTLTRSIDDAGPTLNMYDSTVSQSVLPIFFGPRWHMSDFLPLVPRSPTLDGPVTEPLLANDQGRLVPAVLVPSALLVPPPGGLCAYLIQGAGTWRIPFTTPAPEGDGFLRIDYLQQRPSTAEVSVEDERGRIHSTIPPDRVVFDYQLSHVILRLPITSVAAVIMRTRAPETHLCIGRLTVGAPFALNGSK